MKKLLLTTLVCLMVVGSTSAAFAVNVFTLAPSTYDRLYELLEGPLSTNANTLYLTVPSGVADQSFAPNVGYFPDVSDPINKFGWIRIGVNDIGDSSTYGLPTGYVGSAATVASIGASDLSAYDAYGLNMQNIDQSIWATRLYLKTSTGEYYTPWTWLSPNVTDSAYLDLATVTGKDSIKAIGFEIGSNLTNAGGYPSDSDTAHMKITPTPEPSSMVLLGMGILGLFRLGKRKKV